MKSFDRNLLVFLGALCLILTLAHIGMTRQNNRRQIALQIRQENLNRGFLGPQAQQVSGQVLQEMAKVAESNAKLRDLLVRYGYLVESSEAKNAETPRAEAP